MPTPKPKANGGSSGQYSQTEGGLIYLGRPGSRPASQQDAMGITAFQRGVKLRAQTVAQLPLHVYDRVSETKRVPVRLPFDSYLWDRPNPEMRPVDFWSTAIGHRVSTGNAFLFVETTMGGLPQYLWPLAPDRVKVGRSKDGRKTYKIDNEYPDMDFIAGGNIVHVMGFSVNGLLGISPIMGEAMGLTLNAEEYAARTFTEGSVPGGVLSTDQSLTQKQADENVARWERFHRGVANSHKIAVLDKNLKYASISINPADAQLLETRKYQVTEIARMLGVPPHLIGDVEKSTSWGTGIEEQTMGFLTFTLMDDITAFEQAISLDLLVGTSRFAKWDYKGLLRADSDKRADYYGKMHDHGFMSKDEVRADEDMEALPNGAGAIYLTPLNMGVAGQEGQMSDEEKYAAAGLLIRSGFSPTSVMEQLGLPAVEHLGLLPVTVQKPVDPTTGGAIDPETGKTEDPPEKPEPPKPTTSQGDPTDDGSGDEPPQDGEDPPKRSVRHITKRARRLNNGDVVIDIEERERDE